MSAYSLLLKHLSGQSLFRAVATIFAIILATLIILVTISVGQGWIARDQKTNLVNALFPVNSETTVDNVKNPIYLSTYDTEFDSLVIKELGVRKTAPDSLPAGLTTLPADNEIWVTPGLKHLIDTNHELAERYANYSIKALFPSELAPSPDSLMLLHPINGVTISVKNSQSRLQVSSARELWNKYNRQGTQDKEQAALKVALPLLAGVIVITPVLLLIVEITKIGIVQREKRYAALSLAGVTNRQIRLLIALETLPLGLLGSILGFAIFISVGIPFLANTPIGDTSIWISDLTLPSIDYIIICAAIVICSVIASLQSVSVLKISPLAVTRTLGDIKKPSFFSILPLLLGVIGLSALSAFGRPWYKDSPDLGSYLLIGLVLVIIVGIFFAGSYLTYRLSSIMLLAPGGASTTLAAHRLRSVSRKVFHSISGVVLALLVGALFMTLLATIQATGAQYRAVQATTAMDIYSPQNPLQVVVYLPETGADQIIQDFKNQTELKKLLSDSYIQQGFRAADDSMDQPTGNYYDSCAVFWQRTGMACDTNTLPSGPFIVTLESTQIPGVTNGILKPRFISVNPASGTLFSNSYVLVAKDRQAIESVVNKAHAIASTYNIKSGTQLSIYYQKESDTSLTSAIKGLEALILIILTIATATGGLSLLVTVTGSVFERKRTFTRLCIMGADIGTLAKALSIEVLAPLCTLSLLVVCLGIFTCYCILATIGAFDEGHIYFSLPSVTLWVGLAVTIIFSVLVSLLNIPLLVKLVNFDEMRSE